MQIHSVIGKRKYEDPNPTTRRSLLLPIDEKDANVSICMSIDDLPDYESVMGDEIDNENNAILTGKTSKVTTTQAH